MSHLSEQFLFHCKKLLLVFLLELLLLLPELLLELFLELLAEFLTELLLLLLSLLCKLLSKYVLKLKKSSFIGISRLFNWLNRLLLTLRLCITLSNNNRRPFDRFDSLRWLRLLCFFLFLLVNLRGCGSIL